jgi:hypothetical protein
VSRVLGGAGRRRHLRTLSDHAGRSTPMAARVCQKDSPRRHLRASALRWASLRKPADGLAVGDDVEEREAHNRCTIEFHCGWTLFGNRAAKKRGAEARCTMQLHKQKQKRHSDPRKQLGTSSNAHVQPSSSKSTSRRPTGHGQRDFRMKPAHNQLVVLVHH